VLIFIDKISIILGVAINSLFIVVRASSDMPEVTTHFKEKKYKPTRGIKLKPPSQ